MQKYEHESIKRNLVLDQLEMQARAKFEQAQLMERDQLESQKKMKENM